MSRVVRFFVGLGCAFSAAAFLSGCGTVYNSLGGPYKGEPAEAFSPGNLSPHAVDLINLAFEGFEGRTIHDHHLHFFGNGKPDPYRYCPELQSICPVLRPKTNFDKFVKHQSPLFRPLIEGIYLDTLDVTSLDEMDDQYMKRLVDLVAAYGPPCHFDDPEASPYRTVFHLLAMDGTYAKDGQLDPLSYNVVSNEFVIRLAGALNRKLESSGGFTGNEFRPVGSINPQRAGGAGEKKLVMRDRKDWVKEMDLLACHGVKWIKWRPATMVIDPATVSEEFYRELRARDIGILTHTGDSKGIPVSDELDDLAAPRRMETALRSGVRVGLLHIGRAGEKGQETYSQQFFDLLESYPPSEAKLFGELSGVPYAGSSKLLTEVAAKANGRMINGSDYPAVTPHIFVWLSLRELKKKKHRFISEKDADALDEIYHYNPILFDFVLKRTIRINGERLPKSVFYSVE